MNNEKRAPNIVDIGRARLRCCTAPQLPRVCSRGRHSPAHDASAASRFPRVGAFLCCVCHKELHSSGAGTLPVRARFPSLLRPSGGSVWPPDAAAAGRGYITGALFI